MKEDEIRKGIEEEVKKNPDLKTEEKPFFLEELTEDSIEAQDLAKRTTALEKLSKDLESKIHRSEGLLYAGFIALVIVVCSMFLDLFLARIWNPSQPTVIIKSSVIDSSDTK